MCSYLALVISHARPLFRRNSMRLCAEGFYILADHEAVEPERYWFIVVYGGAVELQVEHPYACKEMRGELGESGG